MWTPPWTDEERAREPRTDRVMRMMAANDDDKWIHQWPEMPGWTGLLRALVIAMRPEMDVRPGEGEEQWMLPWMKEKWGEIRMESHGRTAYQRNAEDFVETLSATLCRTCGRTGHKCVTAHGSSPNATPALCKPQKRTSPHASPIPHFEPRFL